GFWVLDDLEPLRELAADPKLSAAPVHLFTPRPTFHLEGYGEAQVRPGAGQNPPGGVVVDYYLRDAPAAGQPPLEIEILDRDGKLIHSYTSAPARTPSAPAGAPAAAAPAAAAAKAAPAGAA